MLTDVTFILANGQHISPMHKAPWLGESCAQDVPAVVAHLQGEWPCVPFGYAPHHALPQAWSEIDVVSDAWPHGFAANHPWHISSIHSNELLAHIDYPEKDSVHQLKRRLRGIENKACLDITLEISMHQDAYLPIGIHPVFRLPEEQGQAELDLGKYHSVMSYPGDTGAQTAFYKSTPFRFEELTELGFDPLKLPYPQASETLLLVTDTEGCVRLKNYQESYCVHLDWDTNIFPCLMLWISNGGRTTTPWLGRHWALGVEPVCAAFDLGCSISSSENPLTKAGIKTAYKLTNKTPFKTSYSISAEALR